MEPTIIAITEDKVTPIDKLLVGLSARQEKIYKPVLETQLKNSHSAITRYGEEHKEDMSAYTDALNTTAKRTLDKLEMVSELVGVQPMTGPVGLIYSLQYRYLDENRVNDTDEELGVINNEGEVVNKILAAEVSLDVVNGRKMGLEVVSQAVEAGSRSLPFGWSLTETPNEAAIEKTSEKIAEAITHEIISDLRALAIKEVINESHAQDILIAIQHAMNSIGKETRRGVGNKVIVSPDIWEKIELLINSEFKLVTFEPVTVTDQPDFLVKKGILNTATYYVQKDAPKGTALVAYKGGNGDTDTSYFYCPYALLSLMSTKKEHDANLAHFYTRYGKVVSGQYERNPSALCEGKHYYRALTFK